MVLDEPCTHSLSDRHPSPRLARTSTHRSLERIWVSRASAANPSGGPIRWHFWRLCTDRGGVLDTSTAATVGGSVLRDADSHSRRVWMACRGPGVATRSEHGLAPGPVAPCRAGPGCVRPSSVCVASTWLYGCCVNNGRVFFFFACSSVLMWDGGLSFTIFMLFFLIRRPLQLRCDRRPLSCEVECSRCRCGKVFAGL